MIIIALAILIVIVIVGLYAISSGIQAIASGKLAGKITGVIMILVGIGWFIGFIIKFARA